MPVPFDPRLTGSLIQAPPVPTKAQRRLSVALPLIISWGQRWYTSGQPQFKLEQIASDALVVADYLLKRIDEEV